MNYSLKTISKGYLYAYINEYNNYEDLRRKENLDLSYKKFKIKQVARYLNLPNSLHNVFYIFTFLLSKLEVLVYVLVLLLKLSKYSIEYFVTSKRDVNNKLIMFGISFDNERFVKILNSAKINLDEVVIIKLPSIKSDYSDFEKLHLFSGINYSDLFCSFIYSVKISFFMKKKYGVRDLMFRSYTSFEYFLAYFYLKKMDASNSYYFISLLDRWAYLANYTNKNKCLIQHGILYKYTKAPKIGSVDLAYYINEEQKKICEDVLLKNKPKAYYRASITFSSSDLLLKNSFKNILLICNKFFLKKEEVIIRDLPKRKLNLYIKPHPGDKDISPYKNLKKECDFVILAKNDFPKVDFVISYMSTLADEYENEGITVLRYEDEGFDLKYKDLG
ncbi:conserved protein of unknown function [Tenacibaculum jejuense]|uniref:Uncharacterized protein n=2 Tax=Tenacibaculum jejuense TaxID=584609 RepID=A0A238U6S4_9FLAO|nr:conserved protein of unknown function [Tenacibaculum jejuense]